MLSIHVHSSWRHMGHAHSLLSYSFNIALKAFLNSSLSFVESSSHDGRFWFILFFFILYLLNEDIAPCTCIPFGACVTSRVLLVIPVTVCCSVLHRCCSEAQNCRAYCITHALGWFGVGFYTSKNHICERVSRWNGHELLPWDGPILRILVYGGRQMLHPEHYCIQKGEIHEGI